MKIRYFSQVSQGVFSRWSFSIIETRPSIRVHVCRSIWRIDLPPIGAEVSRDRIAAYGQNRPALNAINSLQSRRA
jgi:hypothetical protein